MSADYFKRLGRSVVAPATAYGGPIVVYRISGPDLAGLTSELNLSENDDRKALLRDVFGLDRGVCLFFKNPQSFTGEDVIELHVHGSSRIGEQLNKALAERNVVPALPGEFSFRAFLNDKMTLAEAEALHVGLTRANESSHATSLVNLSKKSQADTEKVFLELSTQLGISRGRIESAIDFSEATEEQAGDVRSAKEVLSSLKQKLDQFLTAYRNFELSLDTPQILIVGEPNAGKSSLLNLLVGSERSLVSNIPGTTRDYIESSVRIGNQKFKFIDTAGIRGLGGEVVDSIEQRGIAKALAMIDESHGIVWVQKAGAAPNQNLASILEDQALVVKIKSFGDEVSESKAFDLRHDSLPVRNFLEQELVSQFQKALDAGRSDQNVFLSERQELLVRELDDRIGSALRGLEDDKSLELIADDLMRADRALKKCRGLELSNDYISEIFSQFCLGK